MLVESGYGVVGSVVGGILVLEGVVDGLFSCVVGGWSLVSAGITSGGRGSVLGVSYRPYGFRWLCSGVGRVGLSRRMLEILGFLSARTRRREPVWMPSLLVTLLCKFDEISTAYEPSN